MATVATLRGYETLPRNDYAAVMNHLATVGPLAVSGKQIAKKYKLNHLIFEKNYINSYFYTFLFVLAVDASEWSLYGGGVFDGCDYSKNIAVNHGMYFIIFQGFFCIKIKYYRVTEKLKNYF